MNRGVKLKSALEIGISWVLKSNRNNASLILKSLVRLFYLIISVNIKSAKEIARSPDHAFQRMLHDLRRLPLFHMQVSSLRRQIVVAQRAIINEVESEF